MTTKSKILTSLYCAIAVLALGFTWIHVGAYLGNGIVDANKQFWIDALLNANAAGKFLAADILYLALACSVWMYVEGRRIGMNYIFGYVLFGALVAISVAFPLFLAVRELKLATLTDGVAPAPLKIADIVVLVVLGGVTVGAGIVAI